MLNCAAAHKRLFRKHSLLGKDKIHLWQDADTSVDICLIHTAKETDIYCRITIVSVDTSVFQLITDTTSIKCSFCRLFDISSCLVCSFEDAVCHIVILYTHSDQTLVNSLHGLLNCEIGGLDCHVITTGYRTQVHCLTVLTILPKY